MQLVDAGGLGLQLLQLVSGLCCRVLSAERWVVQAPLLVTRSCVHLILESDNWVFLLVKQPPLDMSKVFLGITEEER